MPARAFFRALFFASLFALLFIGVGRLALAGANDGLPRPKDPVDRSTPRKTFTGFLNAARAGQFERAAYYLDLRDTPRAQQALKGPELARELAYVLDHQPPLEANAIPDGAQPTTNGSEVVVGTLALEEEDVSITLVHVANGSQQIWVFSRSTVALVPALYAAMGPSLWQSELPSWMTQIGPFGNAVWQWLALVALALSSYLIGRILSWLFVTVGKTFGKRAKAPIDESLIVETRTPLRLLLSTAIFRVGVDSLALTVLLQQALDFVTFTLLVIGISMLFLRMLKVMMGVAVSHLPTDTQYEFRRRELRTRFGLLQRIANVVVVILASGIILTQFAIVRTVGLSVLASAGIAGVVVGLAAQKSMSSVIAGIQISLTQPLRIGDIIKVEEQVGVVEDMSLTNVVVRLFDKRRLIVPISRFLDQPFENWTRSSSDLLGIVTLVVDFATPIDEIRAEAKRVIESSPLWDKRVSKVTVGDVTRDGVQVKVILSAAEYSKLDDLKNATREAMLKWLQQKEGGSYFTTTRTQGTGPAPLDPSI